MRKALLVICVLFAVPSFAQQSKLQLSVFATDPGYISSRSTGNYFTGGIGAALEYRWNQQWALELQVSGERQMRSIAHFDQNGLVTVERSRDTTYPIDLLAHYRFETSSRWKPFVGAGIRYEHTRISQFDNTSAVFEVDGGVHFMITPSLSLRLDAKSLLFDTQGHFDANLKPSVGLGWRF